MAVNIALLNVHEWNRNMERHHHSNPRAPIGGFPWGVWWGLVLGIMGLMVGGQRAVGQSLAPDNSHSRQQAAAGLPPSLVTLGFPGLKPIDWQQYPLPEDCQTYVRRELGMARNTAMRPLLRRRSDDTIATVDPWTVLSPVVVQSTRTCLERYRVADIPPFAVPVARQLAIDVGDDSLWRAIVARQLASIPATAVLGRAALLDSMIGELMSGYDPSSTDLTHRIPAHVQLARTYVAQLDALGPTAIHEQLNAGKVFVRFMDQARDLDGKIAELQAQIHRLQQPGVAALPEFKKGNQQFTLQQWLIQDREVAISKVRLELSFSVDSLASIAAKYRTLYGPRAVDMLYVPAPPLHCDYYFPTPQAKTPMAGPMPTIPAHGQLSVLFFYNGNGDAGFGYPARQLHVAIPQLAITVVSHTAAGFAGHFLVAQPEQAAVLQHQYLADSLGIPGAFCVVTTHYHMTAEGYAIPSPDPNIEAYHIHLGTDMFIVSPMGMTLNGGLLQYGDGDDLVWQLKRFAKQIEAGTPRGTPSPGQP
jgi:hypothetical protein